ncbi:hypothetical protein [Thermocrispum municipale]|jgi:hypothetical protein|uniref:hypothetical protein n=1 Tax=Thermocrispum municipale TaxID=37926 RepID=UPI0012EBE0A3|nr:hypothetical protein [Thermocrispum municipale]
MSWNSGPMLSGNGEAWVSDGDGVVRITDADVLVDEAQMLTQGYEIDRRSAVESGERDRRLFVRVAQTHPSIVRSLRVLTAELADADGELARQVQRDLGVWIGRLGATVVKCADSVAFDQRKQAD